MTKGYQITFTTDDTTHVWKVGIADQSAAIDAVVKEHPNASGISVLPLKDGEFEKLSMHEGQILKSAEIWK